MMETQEWTTKTGKRIKLCVVESPEQMGRKAADHFLEAWTAKEGVGFVAGMPAGNTPIPFYQALAGMFREQRLEFGNVHTFNLDEYLGLLPGHEGSFRNYMEHHLFRHVNIPKGNIHFLDGLTPDWMTTCERYEAEIRENGGIDLQVLGIGRNGHIAFNEPGTEATSRTRLVRLSERTLRENARFFPDPDRVPRYALTMGVQTILESRAILLLATGLGKANAVHRSLCEPPSPDVPASFLQTFPGECTYVLDRGAAGELHL